MRRWRRPTPAAGWLRGEGAANVAGGGGARATMPTPALSADGPRGGGARKTLTPSTPAAARPEGKGASCVAGVGGARATMPPPAPTRRAEGRGRKKRGGGRGRKSNDAAAHADNRVPEGRGRKGLGFWGSELQTGAIRSGNSLAGRIPAASRG